MLFSLSSETAAEEETAAIATEEKKNAESFMVIDVVVLIPNDLCQLKQGDISRRT